MEIWRQRNVATVVYFPLIDRGTLDFENTPPTFVAADCQFSVDKGAFANTGSTPVHEGNGIYSLDLLAAEINGQNTAITVIDSATKLWEDQAIIISTYGDTSAEHAVNLNDAVRAGLTALPNVVVEGAGGLYTRGTGVGQINQDANGRIDTNVANMVANVLTAAAINAAAFTEPKFGADFITVAKMAPGCIVKGDQLTGLNDISSPVTVGTMNANVLNAAAIAANAIEAGKINAGALNGKGDWNIGKTGYTAGPTAASITTAAFAAGAINAAALAANMLTAAKIATAAFTAAKFAAGAIDAAALNADAVDKIRDGLLPTQNATFDDIPFLFVDSTDDVTPVTAASGIVITRSLDGAAFAAVSGTTVTEIGFGMYHIDASAADMNAGKIVFRITASGGTPNAPHDAQVSIITGGGV